MLAKRTRGERAGLSRPAVLAAALHIVDTDGLGGLSMRRLAAELGVEAMTLYHYVSNKDDLLDGLIEEVVTQAKPAHDTADWREFLRSSALALRDALTRHPAVVPLITARPAGTMRNLDTMEYLLSRLTQVGFSPPRALTVLYAVIDATVSSCARTSTDTDRHAHLNTVDEARHPLLAQASRSDTSDQLEATLTALITGFATELAPGREPD